MMLAKFMEWFDKLDDEKFLADVTTPEGFKEKILKLRRARSAQLLLFIFMSCMLILMTYLYSPKVDFSGMFVLLLLTLISFGIYDSQIKMLLLFDKTQPKG